MSKGKSGKRPPAAAAEQATAQTAAQTADAGAAPSADNEASKSKGKDVNIRVKITDNSVRKNVRKDGSEFYGITIPVAGFNGAPKNKVDFVSFAVNSYQYSPATNPVYDTKPDGTRSLRRDENGKVATTPVPGYANIWLHGENSNVKTNSWTGETDANGKRVYAETTVKAGDLRDMNREAIRQYKAAHADNSVNKSADRAAEAAAVAPAATASAKAAPAATAEADDQIDLD